MNNYHYYLKQEIVPHWKGDRRFTSVKWHPENPMALYLVDKGQFGDAPPGPRTDATRSCAGPDFCVGYLRLTSAHAHRHWIRGGCGRK